MSEKQEKSSRGDLPGQSPGSEPGSKPKKHPDEEDILAYLRLDYQKVDPDGSTRKTLPKTLSTNIIYSYNHLMRNVTRHAHKMFRLSVAQAEEREAWRQCEVLQRTLYCAVDKQIDSEET